MSDVQDCEHPEVTAYSVTEGEDAGRVSLWACATCMRRFYPACSTCVDVGHRNVVHPEAIVERLDRSGNRADGVRVRDWRVRAYVDHAEYHRETPIETDEPSRCDVCGVTLLTDSDAIAHLLEALAVERSRSDD